MDKPGDRIGTRPSKEELEELYKTHTGGDIARLYGVSDVAVSAWRRKYGIANVPPWQRAQQGKSVPPLDQLNPVKLAELYLAMGDQQIGDLYGVSKIVIRRLRREYGIQPISKSARCERQDPLTDEQKEVAIGVMLGDGHIRGEGSLQVAHYYGQLNYLRQLHQIFGALSRPITYGEVQRYADTSYMFTLRTHIHAWFKQMRQVMYPQGRRVFPPDILSTLTPRSLAYWYSDDGTLTRDVPTIALGDITAIEARQVATAIAARFSLNTFIPEASLSSTCKILGIRAVSAPAFYFLIRDHLPVDLLYKIPREYWPSGKIPFSPPSNLGSEVDFPADLYNRCKSWSGLDESGKTTLLGEVAAHYRAVGFPQTRARSEELFVLRNLEPSQIIKEDRILPRQVGQASTQAFMPHMWDAYSHGGDSPRAIFEGDPTLVAALRSYLNSGRLPSPGGLRTALRYWQHSGVYGFRPSAARALVAQYCPTGGVVYDPCAGWGGRLMGTLMSGMTYLACDPSTQTYQGLLGLYHWIRSHYSDTEGKAILNCCPAEGYTPDRPVDLVLTSPPYWKREHYCDEATQSSAKYRTYEVWLQEFWRATLSRAVSVLRPGGWVLLNVDDFRIGSQSYPLIEDTILIMRGLGFGDPVRMAYIMPDRGTGQGNSEVVLRWRKSSASSELPSGMLLMSPKLRPEGQVACRTCGCMLPVQQLEGGRCQVCVGASGLVKICLGCGVEFSTRDSRQLYHANACKHLKFKADVASGIRPPRAKPAKVEPPHIRKEPCPRCGTMVEFTGGGVARVCTACQELEARQQDSKSRGTCQYRHCGKEFPIAKNSRGLQHYCTPECGRREKAFRLGKATDESYFRAKGAPKVRTCIECRGSFTLINRDNTCPACRDKARNKTCQTCQASYRDESPKNTRRYCDACQDSRIAGPRRLTVGPKLEAKRRRHRSRIDDLATVPEGSTSWWGRAGELAFLAMHPEARDLVGDAGNKAPYDAEDPGLGRVNVKTARAYTSHEGGIKWNFQVHGLQGTCDTAYLIGLQGGLAAYAWVIPTKDLPKTLKTMQPGTREYQGAMWEVDAGELEGLNKALAGLKSQAPRQESLRLFDNLSIGRIGEAVYGALTPGADHLAARDPLAPYDFTDPDGTRVNVRTRRVGSRSRWTFFRSESGTDVYEFIGLDQTGSHLLARFRVPSGEVPAKGFSVRSLSIGASKWSRYLVPAPYPLKVSELIQVPAFEAIQLEVGTLTDVVVQSLSPVGREALLARAFQYHRALGFPFPSVPSDKQLASDLGRVQAYQPVGQDLPPDNAGLGACSAYMPHRFDTRNSSADFSALGAFHDDTRLARALDFCLRGRKPDLTARSVRGALTALNRTPTQFRPGIAKWACEQYSPEGGRVLDPCAGWGGRLFGVLASGRHYTGVEPSVKTAACLHHLGARLREHLRLDQEGFRVVPQEIQKATLEGLFDMAITSPPYWTREQYQGAEESSLSEWGESFLKPMFAKVYGALKPSGHFVVNIADLKDRGQTLPLKQMALDAAGQAGFKLVAEYRMLMGSFGAQQQGRFEPVMVFQKAS
jgi:tRNA G10  N-methylase Trm11